MNTRKQVLIMSVLLMMMLVIVAIYAAWYPSRATDAESEFETATSERGALLFARNCRLCHGDVAQGGALGGRLPAAPALNRPDLQGFGDSGGTITAELSPAATTFEVSDASKLKTGAAILIDQERMNVTAIDGKNVTVQRAYQNTKAAGHFTGGKVWAFDPAALKDKVKLITNTITCGRVGTAMPAWADTQGGPLSEEQVRQLMTLITEGRWNLVATEDDVEDFIAVKLTAPLAADATSTFQASGTSLSAAADDASLTIQVGNAASVPVGSVILLDSERMAVTKAEGNTLTVSRGADHTTAAAHGSGTSVQLFHGAELHVTDVTKFAAGDSIRMGDERLRIIVVPDKTNDKDKSGVIQVERAIHDTDPLDHAITTQVYKFPETSEPSINASSCGQTAQAPAPAGTPGLIEPFDGQTVNVTAKNVSFDTDTITVNAGGQVRLRLDNEDAATKHNIAVYKDDTAAAPVADGSVGLIFEGVAQDDTVFDVPAAGTYYFHCDVHPGIMFGTFVVQ